MNTLEKVKKPVEAIQCANTFSLLQRKMYNVLLANAAGNLFPEVTHSISMKTLCALMGYRSNDYKTIKEKFRELRRMDIEWDVINEKGNNVWTNTSPLSLARVIEGEGKCEYEFTASLIPFLDRPAQYAKFSLATQARFKSCYGLALYENCERYRNIGYSRSFDIPTFRKLMGVAPSEYIDFFALKRRVIAIAIKEVNQYADFNIEGEYEKKGRVVIAVRFLITNKQDDLELIPSPVDEINDEEDQLLAQLKEFFGLQQKDIDKYLKKYGREYINEKLTTILASDSFKKGAIKNMTGYLKTALAENFQTGISSKKLIEKQRRDREEKENANKEYDKRMSQYKHDYDKYISKEISKLMLDIEDNIKQKIFTAFEKYLGPGGYLNIFYKEGLNNILITDQFYTFISRQYPDILSSMMTFDEYLKTICNKS